MQSRSQYWAIISSIPLGTIHLHLCRQEYFALLSVFSNLKICKIAPEQKKMWIGEPLKTPYSVCFTHFKIFTILLTLFKERWVQRILSLWHKKLTTMEKREYQSFSLVPDLNFLSSFPIREDERASNTFLLCIKYGKCPMTNVFQL